MPKLDSPACPATTALIHWCASFHQDQPLTTEESDNDKYYITLWPGAGHRSAGLHGFACRLRFVASSGDADHHHRADDHNGAAAAGNDDNHYDAAGSTSLI
jgi:hypothetical protein